MARLAALLLLAVLAATGVAAAGAAAAEPGSDRGTVAVIADGPANNGGTCATCL